MCVSKLIPVDLKSPVFDEEPLKISYLVVGLDPTRVGHLTTSTTATWRSEAEAALAKRSAHLWVYTF